MNGHASRDRHLFGPGPKRILSLDGGGVRGVISVAFLERIEAILSEQAGEPARLSDCFDLIGGTSTGAIIACALALGKSTDELKDIYHRLAPRAFQRSRFRIPFLQPKFDVAGLRREIAAIVADQTLDSTELRTGSASWLNAWIPPVSGSWRTTRARPIGIQHAKATLLESPLSTHQPAARQYGGADLFRARVGSDFGKNPRALH